MIQGLPMIEGQIYTYPLDELELSVRAMNVLTKAGCRTIGDLCKLTKADLLKLRNCGRRTVLEIEEVLGYCGLELGELA